MTVDVDVVMVDGDNLSRMDLASLRDRFSERSLKKLYQDEKGARLARYPGYDFIPVPHIGKESVDKTIGMDAVAAYYEGHRSLAFVSNDKDYGATALHLLRKFPDLKMHILCDPARVTTPYVEHLAKHGVTMHEIHSDQALNIYAAEVVALIYELHCKNELSLSTLGIAMRARNMDYGKLKKELVLQGVLVPAANFQSIELTVAAKKQWEQLQQTGEGPALG